MKVVYACIWTLTATPEEFDARTPTLLEWLGHLRRDGRLAGCGAWLDADGGLTLIEASSLDEARRIHAGNPLAEIGTTEIRAWEVFYADLRVESGL